MIAVIFYGCNHHKEQQNLDTKIIIENIFIDKSSLTLNNTEGVWYYKKQPFNGFAVVYFKNDLLKQKIGFYKGKKQGVAKEWFSNGQLRIESNYNQNALTNTYKAWRANGILESECYFVKGKKEGVEKNWYPNGQLSKLRNLTGGKENGIQQAWLANGEIYVNYEAKHGRVFGLKRANLCYKLNDEKVVITKK
ncbi:toxin-antitoxin system YwqK family antitoxin [Wenyingzhuangia sp. 2_MG-2023]|uniref:toxin-antitoxin system YwqK family antitoxin n=1 Tax=Wenyingzhuangia sp. 2_MG-2023 TaxID=3062639 RepID=UPI0026E3F422|nr:hypothetical protein [Wenyingzhuangia sp. 2_MG-2023]MDO6736424.1 hypothetical protein [Wenyingzhuangia sp. 2_MG-2023]